MAEDPCMVHSAKWKGPTHCVLNRLHNMEDFPVKYQKDFINRVCCCERNKDNKDGDFGELKHSQEVKKELEKVLVKLRSWHKESRINIISGDTTLKNMITFLHECEESGKMMHPGVRRFIYYFNLACDRGLWKKKFDIKPKENNRKMDIKMDTN